MALFGAAFYTVERNASDRYYLELTQRLNAPIAMYVAGEAQLIADGRPNETVLATLARHAMVINPTVEIYLLDPAGRILAHAQPPGEVTAGLVDLAPVRAMLSGAAQPPILGDDPRSPDRRKVFSVSEVRYEDRLEGYVYAVLGGARYDELAADLSGSYVLKTSAVAIAALGACVFAMGALLLAFLTRRLRRLTRDVHEFTESGFEREPPAAGWRRDGDEIDRLGRACARMSEQILTQFRQLKESDRLRRELVTNVSHDLRTPLASMQGYIETLIIKGDQLPPDERKAHLGVARKHAVRLGALVSELFELSKLESGSVEPRFEPFSLAELLQDVAQEFELDARRRNVRIVIDGPDQPMMVVADISLIQSVLENLIKNALHFTPGPGLITLGLTRHEGFVGVSVADTGVGIPEAQLPRIFDRFYRARNGEEAETGSTGLGLAIVKRILDLHGSRITVTSRRAEGTRFEFELPAGSRAA